MNKAPQKWHRLAKATDITIEPSGMLIRFTDGRSHRLRVLDHDDHWLLRGLVVRHAALAFDSEPMLAAASRNRQMQLCGLSVDEKAHLTAHCVVPKAGLKPDEFKLLARHLAAECDRLEYLLTGRDRESSSR